MASKSAAKRQRKLKIAIVTMLTICRRQPSGKATGRGRGNGAKTGRQADGWQCLHLQLQLRIQLQLQLGEQGDTYNQYEIYAIFIAANGSFLVLTFLANNAGSVSLCKCVSVCVCLYVCVRGWILQEMLAGGKREFRSRSFANSHICVRYKREFTWLSCLVCN